MKCHFDQLDELMEKMRETDRRSTGLERQVRQSRLATEADVPAYKKTRERMEDAAADQAKYGDSSSAKRVQAGPTSSTSFGMKAEPLALPRRDDVLVDSGAVVPKSCLSLVEIHTLTAAGDLFPAGKASTATRITFYQPPLWFCPTGEIISTIQYAMEQFLEDDSFRNIIKAK